MSLGTLGFLRRRAEEVEAAEDRRAEAARLWLLQANNAFREIRETLRRMANGIERCMYCEDSEGIAIDHFWPKGVFPERAFDWLNYLLVCSTCNSQYKRDQFPFDEHSLPLLLNPTEDEPLDHLRFTSQGELLAETAKGECSIRVYGLNRGSLQIGRKDTWTVIQCLVIAYADALQARDPEWASEIEHTVRNNRFSGVFAALTRIAQGADADLILRPEFLAALRHHPEILSWT